MTGIEIICSACGNEALLKREPVYDGFKKVGVRLLCSSCGHEYPDENAVPYKVKPRIQVFSKEDRPQVAHIFEEDEKVRNCRHCRHYVVNPFVQRCGLDLKQVEATDVCDRFVAREENADHGRTRSESAGR